MSDDWQNNIRELFADNFARRGELGASVSIWQNGREVLNLADGWRDREKTQPWMADTPVLIYSATKGPAAACVLHCMEKAGLSLENRVAEVWPEFAMAGKSEITFGQMLSHRAGLAALAHAPDVFDYHAVIRALEAQPPLWPPDEGHGYHPRTFGFLLDETVRRMSGVTLGEYWRTHFAEPLGLDLWIGLPPEKMDAVSPIHAPRAPAADDTFLRAFADPNSLTKRAFSSPRGLHAFSAMNTPEARTASFPGFGGISTANALAKFYAMLASGGELEGKHFFSQQTIKWMATALTNGFDKVLQMPTAFSACFMKDPVNAQGQKLREIFGPSQIAFGQPGAGGSLGFADPENRIAFAYVMNQMEPGVLPNEKSLRIVRAMYGS